MPTRSKAVHSLSGFIDSEDEPRDIEMMPTPDSNQENQPAAKGKRGGKATTSTRRGRPARQRFSMGKAKPKTAKAKAATKRAPLKDQTNEQHTDTEEVDDFDAPVEDPPLEEVDVAPAPAEKPAKKQPVKGRPKKTAVKTVAEDGQVQRDGEFEYTPTTSRTGKRTTKAKTAPEVESKDATMLETPQVPNPQDDATMLSIEQDEPPQPVYRQASHVRSSSRQPQPYPTTTARRRAGSASSTERAGNDPALRRKLGDLTRKFENMELKYRNLRDVGIKEAEANFDRLRKESDERTKAANDLIASLRSELAIQKDVNKEARNTHSDLSAAKTSLGDAEKRISELTNTMTLLQNENRNLQAKLTASRAASANVESGYVKAPGSAVKGKTPAAKTLMMGSAEAAQAAQIAQLKEDLYSDLTGLILRGVDRQESADVYDCIQTGRNGTLHFKLAVDKDDSSTSYEETVFEYNPRLDQNRDRDLIDILPDFLTEEITFSRVNAAQFYSRVVNTLTRKIVDED